MSQQPASDALVDTYRALLNARMSPKAGPAQPTRGPRGDVGEGTPGRRLKRSCPPGMSLKAYARSLAVRNEAQPTKATATAATDAARWFASKRGH